MKLLIFLKYGIVPLRMRIWCQNQIIWFLLQISCRLNLFSFFFLSRLFYVLISILPIFCYYLSITGNLKKKTQGRSVSTHANFELSHLIVPVDIVLGWFHWLLNVKTNLKTETIQWMMMYFTVKLLQIILVFTGIVNNSLFFMISFKNLHNTSLF